MLKYCGDGLGLSAVCIVVCFVCVSSPVGDGGMACCV